MHWNGVAKNRYAEDWTSEELLRHRIDSLSKGEGTIRIVKRGVGIVQNGFDWLGQRIEQTGRGIEKSCWGIAL